MSSPNIPTAAEQQYFPNAFPTQDQTVSPLPTNDERDSSLASVQPERSTFSRLRHSIILKARSLAKKAGPDAKASRDELHELWDLVKGLRRQLHGAQIRIEDMEARTNEKAEEQDEAIERLKAQGEILTTEIKELAADGAVTREEARWGAVLSREEENRVHDEAMNRATARLNRVVKEEVDDEREFF